MSELAKELERLRDARHNYSKGRRLGGVPSACVAHDKLQKCLLDNLDTIITALRPKPPKGDTACQKCGCANPVWFTSNDLWNRVMAAPDAKGDPGGVLCLNCFAFLADEAGVETTAWFLAPGAEPRAYPRLADDERRQKIDDITHDTAPDLGRAIERLTAFCETQHDPHPPRSPREMPQDYPAINYADVRAVLRALKTAEPPADMVEVWDRLKNHLWQITKLNDDDAPYMRSIAKDTLQALSAINIQAAVKAEREAWLSEFLPTILHGDEKHRQWLVDAFTEYAAIRERKGS